MLVGVDSIDAQYFAFSCVRFGGLRTELAEGFESSKHAYVLYRCAVMHSSAFLDEFKLV